MKSRYLTRDFWLLSQGQLVNQAGSQIALAATAYWLKQSTNSASMVGLLSAVSAVPLLLLGPFGGAWADRVSRRNILIACDLLCGVVSCALAMLPGMTSAVAYTALGLFAGTAVLASAIAFTAPALNALIPTMVDKSQVGSALAFSQASGFLALIIGQLAGGMLLTHYRPQALFWINAASYFISAMAECIVRADVPLRSASTAAHTGIFHDIADGISYMWHRRGMRVLLMASVPLNVLCTPVIVFLPFYTANSLHEPLARYGYLLAAISVGMLAGYSIAGRFPPRPLRRHAALFSSVTAAGLIIFSLVLVQRFWQAAFLLVLLGMAMGVLTLIALNAFIQQTEAGKRGRVNAVLLMTTQGLTPIAMLATGVLCDMWGNNIRGLYGICGALLLITMAFMFANSDLRAFLHYEEPIETTR